MIKKVAVLGSTGSIGENTLSVIRSFPELFKVFSLTANSNAEKLSKQIEEFSPEIAVLADRNAGTIDGACKNTKICYGSEAIAGACIGADIVVLGIMGIAGLPAFEFCLKNSIPVALATKEAMVCGGRVARELMDITKTPVLPVDSELSAIWQCMDGNEKNTVSKIYLTASGGPFRTWTAEKIQTASVSDALRHPTWSMGRKITVDSATMANKGLEIMETRWLFDISSEIIQVVVHPESIIHSMVEYSDNAILAQLGDKDMRIPILHALSYPERKNNLNRPLDIFEVGALHFERPDPGKFPCLALACEAVKYDGELQLVFNSANEVAVDRFLKGDISFGEIPNVIEKAMNSFADVKVNTFEDIYNTDKEIRKYLSMDR